MRPTPQSRAAGGGGPPPASAHCLASTGDEPSMDGRGSDERRALPPRHLDHLVAAGQRHRGQQRDALEQRLDPPRARGERQLQSLDAPGQRVQGDERAPDVRTTAQLRGAEEDGGDRREQVARSDRRCVVADLPAVDDPGEPGDHARGDERPPDQTVAAQTGESGRFGVATDGEHVAADRRVLEHVPHDDRQEHHEVPVQRQPEAAPCGRCRGSCR